MYNRIFKERNGQEMNIRPTLNTNNIYSLMLKDSCFYQKVYEIS